MLCVWSGKGLSKETEHTTFADILPLLQKSVVAKLCFFLATDGTLNVVLREIFVA